MLLKGSLFAWRRPRRGGYSAVPADKAKRARRRDQPSEERPPPPKGRGPASEPVLYVRIVK